MDSIDTDEGLSALTLDDVALLRRQLVEMQDALQEAADKHRHAQEEKEMLTRRREEMENRLSQLEAEYEELLGQYHFFPCRIAGSRDHSSDLTLPLCRENYTGRGNKQCRSSRLDSRLEGGFSFVAG